MVVCPKSMKKMKLCPGQCFLGKFFLVLVLFFLATCHALQLWATHFIIFLHWIACPSTVWAAPWMIAASCHCLLCSPCFCFLLDPSLRCMFTPVHSCITNFHSYSHIVTLNRFCQVKLLFQMHATSTLNILRSKQIVYKVPNVAESLQLHGNYVRQLLLIRPSGQGHLPFSWDPPNGHHLKHTFWQVDCVLEWKQKFRLHSYEICTIPFNLKVQFLHYIRYSLVQLLNFVAIQQKCWIQQLLAALEISSNCKMVKAWKALCVRCMRKWKHLDVKEELSRITEFCAHQSSHCTHRASQFKCVKV